MVLNSAPLAARHFTPWLVSGGKSGADTLLFARSYSAIESILPPRLLNANAVYELSPDADIGGYKEAWWVTEIPGLLQAPATSIAIEVPIGAFKSDIDALVIPQLTKAFGKLGQRSGFERYRADATDKIAGTPGFVTSCFQAAWGAARTGDRCSWLPLDRAAERLCERLLKNGLIKSRAEVEQGSAVDAAGFLGATKSFFTDLHALYETVSPQVRGRFSRDESIGYANHASEESFEVDAWQADRSMPGALVAGESNVIWVPGRQPMDQLLPRMLRDESGDSCVPIRPSKTLADVLRALNVSADAWRAALSQYAHETAGSEIPSAWSDFRVEGISSERGPLIAPYDLVSALSEMKVGASLVAVARLQLRDLLSVPYGDPLAVTHAVIGLYDSSGAQWKEIPLSPGESLGMIFRPGQWVEHGWNGMEPLAEEDLGALPTGKVIWNEAAVRERAAKSYVELLERAEMAGQIQSGADGEILVSSLAHNECGRRVSEVVAGAVEYYSHLPEFESPTFVIQGVVTQKIDDQGLDTKTP